MLTISCLEQITQGGVLMILKITQFEQSSPFLCTAIGKLKYEALFHRKYERKLKNLLQKILTMTSFITAYGSLDGEEKGKLEEKEKDKKT